MALGEINSVQAHSEKCEAVLAVKCAIGAMQPIEGRSRAHDGFLSAA
jgi:hypothetical protein